MMAYSTGGVVHNSHINNASIDTFSSSTNNHTSSRFNHDASGHLNNETRNKPHKSTHPDMSKCIKKPHRSTHPDMSKCIKKPLFSRLRSPLQSPSTGGLIDQSQTLLDIETRDSQSEERQMKPKKMDDMLFARYKQAFSDCFRKKYTGRSWTSHPTALSERIPMTLDQYQELDRTLHPDGHESDARYPSLCYDAKLSIGIIQWMPASVHEFLIGFIDEKVALAKGTLADETLKKSLKNSRSSRFESFEGEYEGTEKEPDSSFYNDKLGLVSVVEIGFSETYDKMISDVNLWLNQVQMVILVCINEDPPWKNPIADWDDEEVLKSLSEGRVKIQPKDFTSEAIDDPASALMFDGKRWVNKLGEVFLEKWKRDNITGVPKRDGERIVSKIIL